MRCGAHRCENPRWHCACPDCECPSNRVRSCYQRRLADTPVGDQPVRIELTVRRLHCDNARCERRTFAEQVAGLTFRYGRRTPALRRTLEAVAVAVALAGRAGARPAVVAAQCGQPDAAAAAADGAS
ncbi:transposase family protein [Streptomyces sp. NPDC053720]|uniref:transposase family protein n=1 Tax=Streptomyces sp. NPDC053720 TaxID=3154855 RepID=UPI003414703E